MRHKDLQTISMIPPFSFLPDGEMKKIFKSFSIKKYDKDQLIFKQDQSKIEQLHIIARGSAKRYSEKEGKSTLRGKLGEEDIYGGVSILMNKGISLRTIKTSEEMICFVLDSEIFLKLCDTYEDFKEYFTNIFSRKMQKTSYSGFLRKNISEKEFSMPFFNQPIESIFRPNLLSCSETNTIKEAAEKMTKSSISSIFVKNSKKEIVGILTDKDLRRRVIAKGYDINRPVADIMSGSLITVTAESQVFEAFLIMIGNDLKHLPVCDKTNRIIGVLTDKDLISAQGQSPYLLIKKVRSATKIDQLEKIHNELPGILLDPIKNGANPQHLTRLITTFSDAILDKIINFAIDELGPAPCEFVFMIMGSEGRKEQTLKTDQDNAIIYENLDNETDRKKAEEYFNEFSDFVCTWLDKAGFDFCEGDNMASNPKWRQPLSVWKKYFFDWTHTADPEDLLYSSIFFDFRGAWGATRFTDELQAYLFDIIKNWSGFLRNLTENALHFKPPIGFFRNIVVEPRGKHKDSFDIKRAIMPIIDFARIYALKHEIRETNTFGRLFRLYTKNILTNEEYNDILQSYNYLMTLRFVRQITALIDEEKKADNYINPKNLSRIDQTMLKEIFKRIEKLQQKINYEFIGIT